MSTSLFREALLAVMDEKDHWAWPQFARGQVPLPQLLPHFAREWEVYVRDFPVLLARVLGHGPPAAVREALAANLYEEQTGGISRSRPHPALFLEMMRGCGYDPALFERVALPPAARRYRDFLDRMSWDPPWQRGAAVLTLFVEGSANERRALEAPACARSAEELERAVRNHPLVRVHGVDPGAMALTRVHLEVEGGHRTDAWASVLGFTPDSLAPAISDAMRQALSLWLAYRDEVALACGLSR